MSNPERQSLGSFPPPGPPPGQLGLVCGWTDDALTGAGNSSALRDEIRSHPLEPLVLLCFDVRGLNAINDAHGHQVGDEILVAACARLRQAIGDHEVYRIDGGEFALLKAKGADDDALARRLAAAAGGEVETRGGARVTMAFRTRTMTGAAFVATVR